MPNNNPAEQRITRSAVSIIEAIKSRFVTREGVNNDESDNVDNVNR